jgi:iron complex transport system permease protein
MSTGVDETVRPVGGIQLALRPARLTRGWLAAGLAAVLVATLAGLTIGPVAINPFGATAAVLDQIPGVNIHTGLSPVETAIVVDLRLPRVVLGLLVGAMLALAGGCYQGVFRNALADPYLLGVAAGAGLGATMAVVIGVATGITNGARDSGLLPLLAFAGAMVAVGLTYGLGVAGRGIRSPIALVLAGVAVANFLVAIQTYLLQRHVETIREVYSFILGSVSTDGWGKIWLLLPYAVVTAAVVLAHRRELDVLGVGDEEAASLGLHPQRSRLILILAASLGTAAAVAVAGLIGFVGIIVPHTIRLLVGTSYRAILPLSILFGAAFLALCDLLARTVLTPSELPIGVVTAFLGAPFFVVVLRTARRVGL